jgi:hypothetical protein
MAWKLFVRARFHFAPVGPGKSRRCFGFRNGCQKLMVLTRSSTRSRIFSGRGA